MSKYPKAMAGFALIAALAAPALAGGLGLGRVALPEEIAAWDLDVRPDGLGLPPGQGSAAEGEAVFEEHCASCHGSFAEGVDNWPKLAGGAGTLAYEDPLKTVGSYWPHLSTAWDFVNRSMPYGNAQTLAADDVYAITAYILFSNDLVDDDFVLSRENFAEFEMPNTGGFFLDDRAETELPQFSAPPCMADCKDAVEITMRARVLDVTPQAETVAVAASEPDVEDAMDTEDLVSAAADPALIGAGEKVFRKCKSCHQVGEDAKNRTGPQLNGIIGKPVGHAEGFKYSKVFTEMAEAGAVWTPEMLTEFLSNPKAYAKGTRMSFKGLNDPEDLTSLIAYLGSFP